MNMTKHIRTITGSRFPENPRLLRAKLAFLHSASLASGRSGEIHAYRVNKNRTGDV